MKQINYIVREVSPERTDLSFYFDTDCYTEAAGGFEYTLFIVGDDRRVGSLNGKEYKEIVNDAENLIDAFDHVGGGIYDYGTFKEAMESLGIEYNSRKCHKLKEWWKGVNEYLESHYAMSTDEIADYLTIITGKNWTTDCARGYCQGDYVEMVYCEDVYKSGVKAEGEIWLGAAKEFCVIEIENYTEAEDEDDEDDEPSYTEGDTCYGYIVADCQAWKDEDYKRLVCEWACIPEDETRLEMIDSWHTYTSYSYRTV